VNIENIYKIAGIHPVLGDKNTARLVINKDKIIDSNTVEGLVVKAREIKDGVNVEIRLKKNTVIENPVHLCFGITDSQAIQKIIINVETEENSGISILAHCVFPNATDVKHIMYGKIRVGKGSRYSYYERHIHGEYGGTTVIPKARIVLEERARFKTEFELLKGRVGTIDIDYEIVCKKDSVMELATRISGTGNDVIKIKEAGQLIGENARGVLRSKIALRHNARAEIINKLIASGRYSRGHVDCSEIIRDNAVASAIPIVEVKNSTAQVTHEAAIGSVDTRQLQTLMSRRISEDKAIDLIIEGMLG